MRTIFVILDGAADLPCRELNGKTPFEAAKKPNLDFFARAGKCGMVQTVGKGIAPESDVAVTALLGYDPYRYFTGRGPLEAYGAGIKLGKDFLALRTNFATMDGNIIVDRRVGRSLTTKEARALADAVNRKVKLSCRFVFKSTTEHRGVLVLYGKHSAEISNVDPAYEKSGAFGVAKAISSNKILACEPLKDNANETAAIINDFVRQSMEVLSRHPTNARRARAKLSVANAILPRDAGNVLPKFPKRKGWAAVVGMPLEIGLAQLAGMQIFPVIYPKIAGTDAYKHIYKSLNAEIAAALKCIKSSRKNLYIHIKETDIPGHDGKPAEKLKMIELIDRELFFGMRQVKGIRLVVTCDHTTPCEMKAHSADAVPLLVYDGKSMDAVQSFSESACREGSMGTIMGKDLMNRIA